MNVISAKDPTVDAVWEVLDSAHVAKLCVVGSMAYGTNRPDSDMDYKGFYVADTEDTWKLYSAPREQFDLKEPDLVVYEMAKFFRLAANANPNVLEVLWAPTLYEQPSGARVTAARQMFLSRRVRFSYGGYAVSQLEKARKGVGGSRGVKHFKREKFLLHLFRLMEQGTTLLEDGALDLRVSDPERLWEQAHWPLDRAEREFKWLDERMEKAYQASSLPANPDHERIDAMLVDIRRRHLLQSST